ncbi:SurA N-terminal domain-containing protein [Rhizobacter sp. Root404]|uniref:SurA N-terminal domain-containing protein n=1 Tax=Rhizobacter sp. Root404 TaxID=1736528 RepID=UPI0006FB2DA4|nr:SurA N-terminal domain-containing protein [Rhizobacter sp. Root404]KQW36600.1 peptidylprolyl isomerase [Rhizobacter sp. Root404]
MFDFFRKHTWLLQVILGFVILAFVGGGVYQGYGSFMGDDNSTVAKVDGRKITRNEWELAQREQIERVRRQMPNVDPKVFDTPDMKRQSLDAVVRDRVMLAAADKLHLATTDDRLQRLFATDPQFAFLRNPDGSVNKDALSAQGMSSEMFAQRLRQDFSQRQVAAGITGTVSAPLAVTAAALDAMFQQREVQVQRFATKDSIASVTPTDADIEKYYKDPANAAQFMAPETESIEYVVLDLDSLKKGVTVSDKELREYYAANERRFTTPEERRASHILVKVDAGASAADRAKAKAKAEGLLAEVRKNPASFADLARKNSDDPGSAEKGGDLDFFARDGLAAKPLEDAAFKLKPDEIGDLVESEFGYHVVKLTAVRGGDKKPFDAVKAELENEVRTQLAQKRFSEAAVEFTNTVYEQPDSLKPVIDKLKLELRTAQNVKRTPAPGATGVLANPKFLDALFGTDAVRNKRNTEAIEVAASTLASGRVVKYEAAHQLPLEEVKAGLRERLIVVQAAARARKLGEARLAELRAAPATALPDAAVIVSRAQTRELPGTLVDAVLKAPVATLPAFVGVDLGDQGYAVAKIVKVLGRDPATADATRAQAQYAQAWGEAEAQAYYTALKSRLKVEIRPSALPAGSGDAASAPAAAASAK